MLDGTPSPRLRASTGAALPPFTGGGFVPPTKDALKQEVSVLKVLAKYASRRSSCDSALLDDLTLAYTSASGTKITAVHVVPKMFREQAVSSDNVSRYSACLDRSAARTTSAADDLEQKQQLPACLPKAALVAAAIAARDFGAASSGAIFCASPGGAFVDGAPLL